MTYAPVSSLFTSADLVALRRDRLMILATTYFPTFLPTDEYLLELLLAAESELQHDLRVFFTPRLVLADSASDTDIAAAKLAFPTLPIIYEPGYDYDPKLFNGESWGLIKLRQKPIGQVLSIGFNYPQPTDNAYLVPASWIRPDKKYGIISLLPNQANVAFPLNSFLLSALGGGMTIPFLMQISYTCGLQDARADYPDLLMLCKRLAMCMLLENAFFPASGSISVDGLSQSLSMETGKYREQIEARVDKLRDAIHGVRMVIC